MNREDMKHHSFMLLTEGRLTLAPIEDNLQRVLDLGTGTGMLLIYIFGVRWVNSS